MKIALIAMNGTPIQDPVVSGIVKRSQSLSARLAAVASLPSLGLLTAAGVIRGQADTTYLQCSSAQQISRLPCDFDLIAISTLSAQIEDAFAVAEHYKAMGKPVVIGGMHASVRPNDIIEMGFTAAIGEAELIWLDILRDAECGKLRPRYGDISAVCDITTSPIPAFELLDPQQYRRIPVQTSRGCPHRCEFCGASVLLSPSYRQKKVEQVLVEIDRITETWRRPFIEFVDDNALVDKKFWKSLMRDLVQRKIRWFAECDISVGADDQLLTLMRESGCREVLIGLESSSAADIAGIELNADWKRRSHAEYQRNLANIQNHGIRVIGCFMLGLDNQCRETAEQIFSFVNDNDLFDVQLTLQTAFPGTPLHSRLEAEGRLIAAHEFSKCTLFDLNFVPQTISSEDIVQSFHELLQKLHSDDQSAARRNNFKRKLRQLKQQKEFLNVPN
jgi:radical SAM superfamily enzyme YgiQ (UPF0313 family)